MVFLNKRIDLALLLLTAFQFLLVVSEEPRLEISPSQSFQTAPANKAYGIMCRGKVIDGDDDENAYSNMKWINPRGEVIPLGTPGVKDFGASGFKLSFVTPSIEESGQYKCTAVFRNTQTLEVTVDINFYDDIQFEDCDEVQNLVEGKAGKIRCKPLVHPQPSINWEKNKKRVQSERFSITPSGIEISMVSAEDAGVYTVEAFVFDTGRNKYRNITVNVLTPPRIIEIPEEFVAIQGEEYTITCKAEGSTPLTYTWFDPELRDLSTVEGYKVNEGVLTIQHVERHAGGEYKCKVKNLAAEDEASVRLNVQVRPTIVQLDNLTKEENKVATIECKAEGVPQPTLTLRKDNSYLPLRDGEDDRIELEEVEAGDYRILRARIINVRRSDDGLYFCKASNTAGDAERAGHLEVQFRPDMTLTPKTNEKAWSSRPANLSCIAEANPNATITWKFQNEIIEPGDTRFKIQGSVSYSSLLVVTEGRSQFEVFGVYTCEARNALGENFININLEEATAPGQVTQIVFDKVTSTTITFRLMGPGNTGGMPITHFTMKYRNMNEPEQSTVTVEWIKDAPYILSDLKPRAKYQFSVTARNVVGEGPAKVTEYVMPEETVPESPVIITEQETVSNYPDRFEVRWEIPNDNGEVIQQFDIRYFKVERQIKGWTQIDKAMDRVVRNWESKPSFELTGLHPDTYYKIELRATNKIGNSLPEIVVFKTRTVFLLPGEVNDGHISTLDEPVVSLPVIIAIVLVALFITLVILDVTCFFRYHCGLLYLMRYRMCGRSPDKGQKHVEDGRACKLSHYEEKPKNEVDNPAFENSNIRPADLIIDENYKNKSPKGSKTSIGKSSPV